VKYLEAEVTIGAPPRVVWEILSDLDRYSEWNPFVIEAEGTLTVGSRLMVRLRPPDGRVTTFRPTVTVVEPERTFEWLGHLGVRGVFDGRHRFQLEPTAAGTRLVQSEQFGGILVLVLSRSLETSTRAGFEAMNQAIKTRSEAAVGSDG
jgi:hypothetical protein